MKLDYFARSASDALLKTLELETKTKTEAKSLEQVLGLGDESEKGGKS